MTNELNLFASNLNSAMSFAGMTASQTAAKSRIPESEFNLYAKGICFPDADTLGRIADNLHVRVQDLAGDQPIEYTSFGQELRALREGLGLKRTELSELTGVPYKSLVNYESDKVRHVEEKNMEKLEDVLGEPFAAAVNKYGMKPVKKARVTRVTKPKAPKAKVTAPKPVTAPDKGIEKSWFDTLRFVESDRDFRKAVNTLVYNAECPNAEQYPEAALVVRMIRKM